MEVCLERSGSLGEANFETSLHVIVWNKLINRQRVGGCSHHACYVDLSVLWRNEGGGGWIWKDEEGEGCARNSAAVRDPPRTGPASSVKGYVSFGAANPPAPLPLPHNRTAATGRRTRPTVSEAVSH